MSIEFTDGDGDRYTLALVTPEAADEWEVHNDIEGIVGAKTMLAALQQNDALRIEVLKAVLPSEEEMASLIGKAMYGPVGDDGALIAMARDFRKALGVAE